MNSEKDIYQELADAINEITMAKVEDELLTRLDCKKILTTVLYSNQNKEEAMNRAQDSQKDSYTWTMPDGLKVGI